MLRDIIGKNRSCRRFREDFEISRQTLEELVDLARLSPSAGNLQPLKYLLSYDEQTNAKIFLTLAWAGYFKDWPGPAAGERPSAYIIILGDTTISKNFGSDQGIAAQSILLGAREINLAGCIIGIVQRQELIEKLKIPSKYEILLVIALGKPKEQAIIETTGPDGDIKYWRDENGVHHVPKRPLSDIIIQT